MDRYRLVLGRLLDIGGMATLNNFYSIGAQTPGGTLVTARRVFRHLADQNLISALPTITKVRNKAQEQFFTITRNGADYLGRAEEYRWRGKVKSPYNIMHESMIRDIALSFLRYFPDFMVEQSFNENFEGIRPDIVVRMDNKKDGTKQIFLVEVERKKSPDRVIADKISRYENFLAQINFKQYNLNAPVKILIIYATLENNIFLRPQEYRLPSSREGILKLEKQLDHLIYLSGNLSESRYRYLTFHNFNRLHETVWHSPQGHICKLIK